MGVGVQSGPGRRGRARKTKCPYDMSAGRGGYVRLDANDIRQEPHNWELQGDQMSHG